MTTPLTEFKISFRSSAERFIGIGTTCAPEEVIGCDWMYSIAWVPDAAVERLKLQFRLTKIKNCEL